MYASNKRPALEMGRRLYFDQRARVALLLPDVVECAALVDAFHDDESSGIAALVHFF